MLLVSNHLRHYMNLTPLDVVRINMAWYDGEQLHQNLSEIKNKVFIDIPSGRTKPPNNRYSVEQLAEYCRKYKNIRYVAVSNVEHPSQITDVASQLPDGISVVPKIETIVGVNNIAKISEVMVGPKVIMIDHDDLCSDLIRHKEHPSTLYEKYIGPLVAFCKNNGISPLRTAGVVFSDE